MHPCPYSGVLADTVAVILAGGRGERLYPLTLERTKGAVPFAGTYRLIDFTLSNCLHSRVCRINVLPQYKYASLEQHLRLGWNFLPPQLGTGVALLPPQQRVGNAWYGGTADAVYQNLYSLHEQRPSHVLVLSSDHLYRMDYRLLVEEHVRQGAALTVACLEAPVAEARRFGVLEVDAGGRVFDFAEKPAAPRTLPCSPDRALVSMGIYVFEINALIETLAQDAEKAQSTHDFGTDVIPGMIADGWPVYAYNAPLMERRPDFYWRDVGTLDSYWTASMEVLQPDSGFALDDPEWPVHTYQPVHTPMRATGASRCELIDALLCDGASVAGARVERSIVSPGVWIDHDAEVVESVLMDGVHVGPGARVHRAVVDKNAHIPAGKYVGVDLESSAAGLYVTPGGITVVPKGMDLSKPDTGERDGIHSNNGNRHVPARLVRLYGERRSGVVPWRDFEVMARAAASTRLAQPKSPA